MPKITDILLCASLAVIPALPLSAQTAGTETDATATAPAEVTAGTVLATVNGTDITVGHLVAAVADLKPEEQRLPDQVLFNGLLERLIQQAAVVQPDAALSTRTSLRLENARRELVAGALVEKMAAGITVTDADIQAAYDEKFANFAPVKEYNASHILVATEDEAKAIVADLEGGADFATVAKEKSTGPSGPSGGNLGWFGPGRMVPEFEAAVVALEKSGVSAPVQTQFGWHVIKLNDTRLPEAPTLDQSRAELQNTIFRDRLLAKIDKVVGAADTVRQDITGIDPSILRNAALLDD